MKKNKQKTTVIVCLLLAVLTSPLQAACMPPMAHLAFEGPKNKDTNNAFISPAWKGDLAIVNYLFIQSTPSDNKKKERNYKGKTFVQLFQIKGLRLEIIKYIGVEGRDGYRALLWSIRLKYLDCAKYITTKSATKGKEGKTVLHWSAQQGDLACLHFVLQQGVDLHSREKDGRNALHFSAREGTFGLCQVSRGGRGSY